jgi:hypothetical protein
MDPNKKKTVILAALLLSLLAIGAWQFMGGKSEAPKASSAPVSEAPKPIAENVGGTTQEQETDLSLVGLKRKDPFQPGTLPVDEATKAVTPPVNEKPSPSGPVLRPQITGLPPAGVTPGSMTPSQPMIPTDAFDYTLVGVVEGPNPVAVFKSSSGNQTMVRIGGSIGENAKVVDIRGGRVIVNYNKKTTTLSVGGNTQ